MKALTRTLPRGTLIALLVHGALLCLLSVLEIAEVREYVRRPRELSEWHAWLLTGGWTLAAIGGAAIAILSMLRLWWPAAPSSTPRMPDFFFTIFVIEVILFFFANMILDCGVIAEFTLRFFLALNLLLLGISGVCQE
jgi:hypothetical protein